MSRAQLRVGAGARAVEELLLEDLDELAPRFPEDLRRGLLRVVVPSSALRLHVMARLAKRAGAAVGVAVHTLRGLAVLVLDAAGERPRPGASLVLPLARRAAARQPALAPLLSLEGGARAVGAAVRDLLDAGLDGPSVDAAVEALAERVGGRSRERAEALMRSALQVLEETERHGLAVPAAALRRAADLLSTRSGELLPARALLVHGFADATGAATELIQALLRLEGARLYLDRPPDAARPDGPEPGRAFSMRFAERALPGSTERPPNRRIDPAPVELVKAPGPRAEAAELARRVQGFLDEGCAPEAIGVVVRHPARQLGPLRAAFLSAGLPFSCGRAAGPPGAAARRLAALRRVLASGERAAVEDWLDLCSDLCAAERGDRLTAIRHLGAARLRDLPGLEARLDLLADERGRLPLPLRRGLATIEEREEEEEDEEPKAVALRRKLPVEAVRKELARAGQGLTLLASRPLSAPARGHVRALAALLTGPLGWDARRAEDAELLSALRLLEADLPSALELSSEEAESLLEEALSGLGQQAAGGAGGGVQLLALMEARGLTFERLVVPGLNRDAFPRVVREDPLLPDLVRRALRDVLPDLGEKSLGVDEERFLFAQLLGAAPRVLLSWCSTDEEGKPRPVSPLLERLLLERRHAGAGDGAGEVPQAPHAHSPPRSCGAEPRPALDHAVAAGLHGTRAEALELLPCVLGASARAIGSSVDLEALAAVRGSVLAEWDAAPGSEAYRRASPFFGLVGPLSEAADPRSRRLAITRLEDVARCGWRAFVRRVLHVEPIPDPLGSLPGLSKLLIGQVVHEVLELSLEAALGEGRPQTLEGAIAAGPVRVDLPPSSELASLFEESVARHAAEGGLFLGAFSNLVVERCRALFDVARALDWAAGPVEVLGVELAGTARLAGGEEVDFVADRVDLDGGVLRLVDYKTGRPPSGALTEVTRRKHHLAQVSRGAVLQASAYVQAGGEGSVGRLVYLREGLPDDQRVYEVRAEDRDFAESFESAMVAAEAAWRRGGLVPRLETEKEESSQACQWCEVRQACVRGDSGARMRLREWLAADGAGSEDPVERAARGLFRLGREASEPTT